MRDVKVYLSSDAVVLMSGFEAGSGPIFLDQLRCSGSEASLLDCDMGRSVGLHRCNHTMDVGVTCTGRDDCLISLSLSLT